MKTKLLLTVGVALGLLSVMELLPVRPVASAQGNTLKDKNQMKKVRRKTPRQYVSKPMHALLALAIVLALALISGQTLPSVMAKGKRQHQTLDTNFGSGGKVTTDVAGSSDVAQSVAIQQDGKIVVAGTAINSGGPNDFALARYNSDGTPDATFGTDGKVTTDFAGSFDVAIAVALQADGKIVVAGSAVIGQFADFGLARYNSDGTLDLSFGTGGKVTTDFGQVSANATSVALQADGKIVAAGQANINDGLDFALARYNSDGTLDANFGTGGTVTTDFIAGSSPDLAFSVAQAFSVALQADGKIVAAGQAFINGGFDFALARYNSDGTLDASFGTNGTVTNNFSGSTRADRARSVAVQPDGKIVAAGTARTNKNSDFALARYNSDGTLDLSFGTGGIVTTDFGGSLDVAFAVALQADGKIVAAGQAFISSNSDFALARYNSDGTLDLSFGTGGKVTTDFVAGSSDQAFAVALQPDGKIVVAGFAVINGDLDFALARYK